MSLFTVLGATGFIGRHLAADLRKQGYTVQTPDRHVEQLSGMKLGHVIYCIGTTGNFRQYPQAAVDAHVNKLYSLMNNAEFESWLYLSSTRVYERTPKNIEAFESANISVMPSEHSIFDLTKLLGEAVCLDLAKDRAKIVRLSNVYGYDQSSKTFLGKVMDELGATKRVEFQDAPESEKDYISIDDAVSYLIKISLQAQSGIYNVAKGENISHRQIADRIRSLGYDVSFNPKGILRSFPRISSEKVSAQYGLARHCLLEDLSDLLQNRRELIV